MTAIATVADLQQVAAQCTGREWLSGAEVREFAAERGIELRTLERYEREGLISASQRLGLGRGNGVAFRFPSRAVLEIALVAEARKATHSTLRIRHWLWWIGYPIDFERWRADRIEELAGSALGELLVSDLPPTARDREAARLAGNRRSFPPRRRALRLPAGEQLGQREQLAQWIFDARFGGLTPDPAEALEDGPDATVGDALDRAFMSGLRADGWVGSAPLGAQIAELLTTTPNFGDSFRRFEALTEAQARDAWRVATTFDALGLFKTIGLPVLRNAPLCSALVLCTLIWAIPDTEIAKLAALAA